VVSDSIKKAEDSDDLIVRLYEAHGGRGPVCLTFANAPESVTECDLMEENDTAIKLDGTSISFDIRPWDIRTFKIACPSV
jgi:alpha-mannosidase